MAGDRWPPVYDAEDLVREIKRLTERQDIALAFYEWRRDSSMTSVHDVCQGDIVRLGSDVPVIFEDGEPGVIEHPDAAWLVVGNTCDFERDIDDVRWTQLVPLRDLGSASRGDRQHRRRRFGATRSRAFSMCHHGPLTSPLGCTQRISSGPSPWIRRAFFGEEPVATVEARMERAAWVLLNACLVRFLARDDGRYG